MSLHARKMNSSRDVAASASARQAIGYMIDAQGREVPITEQMIQRACADLHDSWVSAPRDRQASARS